MSDKHWEDRRELVTDADADRLFRAWAEPEHIAGWFADSARGSAEPGGTLVHVFEELGMELPFQVEEVEPGKRLVLSAPGPDGPLFRQQITVSTRDGRSVLELVHSGFGPKAQLDDEYEGQDSGWQLALAILALYVEIYWDRPRTRYMAVHPASFEYEALAPHFRDPSGWLATDGAVGDVGDPVRLSLADREPLSGRVIARSSREVAVTWDEIDGVLELKAFDMGPGERALSLRASSWSEFAPDVAQLQSWMAARCAQLAELLAYTAGR